MNKKVKHGTLLTVIFTVLSLLYLYPIVLVFINSFKKKAYISKAPFEIPTGKMYVGLENYIRGIKQTGLIQAFGWSLFITILSVAVIILCCSMCAWYICRVKTKFTKILYMLCLVCNDRTIPDGNVYIIQDRKYASYGKSVGTGCDLPWIWCRTFRLYVHRIHEIHSTGD